MSLLGIDVGTTGCKAAVFTSDGELLSSAYAEYDIHRPQTGWAELDAQAVWRQIKQTIAKASSSVRNDPIRALAVSSLGESMAPVDAARRILGPSLTMADARGEEYLASLAKLFPNEELYAINGNTIGNHYSLPKLMWLREHDPKLFEAADKFLLWGSLVLYMLGAEPAVDYSLANRTLLFDLNQMDWSEKLLARVGFSASILPKPCPAGTSLGTIAPALADELGLPRETMLVAGAHDQCANALGCGAVQQGRTMLGMGTFLCMTPVFEARPEASAMITRGLNTEHHAIPGCYVTFIYNQGGNLFKWFRDTFASAEHKAAVEAGRDIYASLLDEMPAAPSTVMALPHFEPTGPPEFIMDSAGVLAGLRLSTSRGDVLKGILEGSIFYLRECLDMLPGAGIEVNDFRAVGGGSKSDQWLQICADIMQRPVTRPAFTEAGVRGAAMLAGIGAGVYASAQEAVDTFVQLGRSFEPDAKNQSVYEGRFGHYVQMRHAMRGFLHDLVRDDGAS